MCSNYQEMKERVRYLHAFREEPPAEPGKVDLWPGHMGSFIRCHCYADIRDASVPTTEAVSGIFGLLPHWATDTKTAQQTDNAKNETVAEKPSYRDAWKRVRPCIIPVSAIYEPDSRGAKQYHLELNRPMSSPWELPSVDWWKGNGS